MIYLGLGIFALGVTAVQHGKHSFWSQLIAFGLSCWLLSWGGFFNQVPA